MLSVMWRNQGGLQILLALLKLFMETLTELRLHSGAASNDDLTVEDASQVDITILNASCYHIVHSWIL
jgi:hypothetical protein